MSFALEHAGPVVHDAAAASGDYVAALQQAGHTCTGSDINGGYVAIAKGRGLPVEEWDAAALGLPDDSVDTVLLFEVLEHVPDPDVRRRILQESKRVARRNVLITTPHSGELDLLFQCGLTYEHMLDRDHSVFFTEPMLRAELGQVFDTFTLTQEEEIDSRLVSRLFSPRTQKVLHLVSRVKPYQPKLFFRFYAVASAQ
nr:class I SAM-dependent methyltransferase [Motilibacter deserti]